MPLIFTLVNVSVILYTVSLPYYIRIQIFSGKIFFTIYLTMYGDFKEFNNYIGQQALQLMGFNRIRKLSQKSTAKHYCATFLSDYTVYIYVYSTSTRKI